MLIVTLYLLLLGRKCHKENKLLGVVPTGNVTGPHLHFEVREGGSRFRTNNVDPLDWIVQ